MFWSKKSFRKLKNHKLKKIILRMENVKYLEDILSEEVPRMDVLEAENESVGFDYGSYLSIGEVKDLLVDVKKEIDCFLDVDDVSAPDCCYYKDAEGRHFNFDHYLPFSETLMFKKRKRVDIVPIMAHEYTHHVQNVKNLPSFHYAIVKEGHARGVERHLVEKFTMCENNNGFVFNTDSICLDELQRTYRWFCEENGCSPKKELLEGVSNKGISCHAMGTSLFFIYERRNGFDIYKEVVHKNVPECFLD